MNVEWGNFLRQITRLYKSKYKLSIRLDLPSIVFVESWKKKSEILFISLLSLSSVTGSGRPNEPWTPDQIVFMWQAEIGDEIIASLMKPEIVGNQISLLIKRYKRLTTQLHAGLWLLYCQLADIRLRFWIPRGWRKVRMDPRQIATQHGGNGAKMYLFSFILSFLCVKSLLLVHHIH